MALEAHVAPAVALRLLVIEAGKRNVPCQSLLFLSAGRPRSDLCSGEMNDEWEKPRLQGQGSERRLCGEDAALTRAPVPIRFRGERNCTITFSYSVLLVGGKTVTSFDSQQYVSATSTGTMMIAAGTTTLMAGRVAGTTRLCSRGSSLRV